MAVPKKKMSKSRRDSRKSYWKKKVIQKVLLAISLSRSLKGNNVNNFILPKNYNLSFVDDKFKLVE